MTVEQSPDGTRKLAIHFEADGRRRVEQAITLDDGRVATVVHHHPDVLTHPHFMEGIDPEICLHQGQFFSLSDKVTDPLEGDVRFIWNPSPHILARGTRETRIEDFDDFGKAPSAQTIWTEKPELSSPSGFTIIDSASTTITVPPKNSASFEFSSRTQDIGNGPVDRIRFLIPNGWDSHDGHYTTSPENLTHSWASRLTTTIGPWEMMIDVTKQASKSTFRKQLKASGGRAITHIGEIRKIDGSDFSPTEADSTLESIRIMLNLAAGRRINPVLPVGYKDDEPVWSRWSAPPVDHMTGVDTWVDPTIACKQVADLLAAGSAYCSDPAKQQVIKYATSYYVSANIDVDVEPAIGLAISGMQLLSHQRFVNERQTFASSRAFEDSGNTEKQIRDLLDDCQIDTDIPSHFTHLASEAASMPTQSGIGRDGLGAAILLRNKITHPTKTLPNNWDLYAWAEASILVRHYFRLALLNTLGYNGQYRSAISTNRWIGKVDTVPWV